jgi:hypothetical protein
VVGWYRGGATIVPRISVRDAALHLALFPHPWQIALLRERGTSRSAGAVVRVEPAEGRPYSVPFYELLPAGKNRPGARRTAITWSNYRSEADLPPLPESAFVDGPQTVLVPPTRREPPKVRRSVLSVLHRLTVPVAQAAFSKNSSVGETSP